MFFVSALHLMALHRTLYSIGLSYGLTGSEKGNLISAQMIGSILAALLGGRISDIWGRKKLALLGLSFSTLGTLMMSRTPAFEPLLAYQISIFCIFLVGSGMGIILSISNALMFDLHPQRRVFYVNLGHSCFAGGAIAGPFIANFLIQFSDWPLVYLVNGILTGTIFLCLLLSTFPKEEHTLKTNVRVFKGTLKKQGVIWLSICIALYAGSQGGFTSWIVEYLSTNNLFTLSERGSGFFLSYFWIAVFIGRLNYGWIVERSSPFLVLLLSCLVGAGSILLLTKTAHPLGYLVFICLYGLSLSGMLGTLFSLIGQHFPHSSGTIAGMMMAISGAGGAILPNLIGRVTDVQGWGISAGIRFCALYLLAIAVIISLLALLEKNSPLFTPRNG